MSTTRFFLLGPAVLGLAMMASAASAGHITKDMESVEVMHKGEKVMVTRTEDAASVIPDAYLKTGRHCPPFCIQPMKVADGVETVGELEVLSYLEKNAGGDTSILVVDSRTPEWIARGTIPGSVNIPWTTVTVDIASGFMTGAELTGFNKVMTEQFGAKKTPDDGWDFSDAKTLVLFCNGIWCHQSGTNIETLLRAGYPAEKLKWYRGGMQDWVTAGLTTVNH